MSVNCLDTDALVSVGAALEWDLPARLDHLAGCERCRAGLADIAQLRHELTAVTPVEEEQHAAAAAVAAAQARAAGASPSAINSAAAAFAAAARRADRCAAAATFLVAGATMALLVLLLAGNRSAPLALAIAAIAGTASILPIHLPFRRQSA